MPPQVAVIGDALLDVHVTASSAMRPGADIPARVRLEPGGQGANLAVRLARRGVDVRLTCALGDDTAGAMLRNALAADGVDLRPIPVDATGSVVVLVAVDGERTMLSQRVPLAQRLDASAADAGWLVLSGYLLLESDPSRLAAWDTLPERRAVIGCAIEPAQAEAWISVCRALRPSLLVLNHDEASTLADQQTDAGSLAGRLARDLDAVVVVTDWRGATAAVGDRVMRVDAPQDEPATDTTGAGDAFAAALIAELLAEPWPPGVEPLERAMAAASRLASAVARTPGAQGRVAGEPPARLGA